MSAAQSRNNLKCQVVLRGDFQAYDRWPAHCCSWSQSTPPTAMADIPT